MELGSVHVPRKGRRGRPGWFVIILSLALSLVKVGAAAGQVPAASADSALLELLRSANPELAAGRAAVAAAEARQRATGFAPPVSLSVEAEEIPSGVDLSRATASVGLEREFFPRGQRAAAQAVAGVDVRSARAQVELTEQRLLAEARRGLVRVAGGERMARRLAAEDSLLEGAESALRLRFSVGEARYVDVLRLRTERLRIQSSRAEALAEVRAGRSILEALLGGAPGGEAATRLGGLLEAALGDTLASAPDVAALLAGSPAVRLAELALERARAERALVLAGQRPRISAAAGLQRFEGEDGFVVGPALGLSVSLPGTARAANRTALGAADAAVAAAEARRAATVASVRGALLTALVRYEAARERLALFDAALLRGARQEREAALAAYASGDLSLLELIDFERALARAEIERIRTLTDAADAYAALLSAAAGTGAESESPTLRPTNDDDR